MSPTESRSEGQEQPLELILARNLVSIVSLAALLVDVEGRIVFYNDAAAEIVGSPVRGDRDDDPRGLERHATGPSTSTGRRWRPTSSR